MKQKSLLLMLLCLLLGNTLHAQTTQLTVATSNLRNDNENDRKAGNAWETRLPAITQLIRFHEMDIFGTQECRDNQINDLSELLPGYAHIGVGREDGKKGGEYSAIFYRTDLFDLLGNGDFWLSETPDKPSTGWDAALPRICTWGKFKTKDTGLEFMVFNLHMDHKGENARLESALLVQQKMREMANGLPVILMGDFNVDQSHQAYRVIEKGGLASDCYDRAKIRYATNGTFNNFDTEDFSDSRIDHIFVSPAFAVKKYGILTDTYRTPVTKTVKAKKKKESGEKSSKVVFKQKGAYRNPNTKVKGSSNTSEDVKVVGYESRLPSDHFPVMVVLEYEQ